LHATAAAHLDAVAPTDEDSTLCGKGKEVAVTRLLLTASVLATLCVGLPATLRADPGGPNLQEPVVLDCTGGLHVAATPGTLTNRGRVLWAIDSTSVFVDAYFAITDGTDTFVIYDSKQGLRNLVSCTADLGGGLTALATGFFTPR
jgi:hypothetical protein